MGERILLGHAIRGEHRHAVYAWERYGVVCPSLVTTNGSARVLVGACSGYEPKVQAEPSPEVDMAEHLKAAYFAVFPSEKR